MIQAANSIFSRDYVVDFCPLIHFKPQYDPKQNSTYTDRHGPMANFEIDPLKITESIQSSPGQWDTITQSVSSP